MLEIILTLLIVGAIAGFIYSVPVAGPISIIVVSKAFQGKLRFCERTALGAAIVEFVFVFVAVFGIAALFKFYQPFVPYILLIAAVFVIIIGLKIKRQKIDLKSLESQMIVTDKYENRGGLRTGLVLNLTNPVLFINWIIASFVTLSFVSSIGLNTGGLDMMLNESIKSVSEITGTEFDQIQNGNTLSEDRQRPVPSDKVSPLIMSLVFAFGVGSGAYIWLYILAKTIIKYREKIKTNLLNKFIYGLGFMLVLIGIYLGYQAVMVFMA